LANTKFIYTAYLNQNLAFYLSPFKQGELVFGGTVAVMVKEEPPHFLGEIKNYRLVKALFRLLILGKMHFCGLSFIY
jgi:hypothetical protein